jgi:RNA polymerase sigma-70 factor (ECF subfamily)
MPISVETGETPPAGAHVEASAEPRRLTLDAVYRAHAPFVWRSACRLGVPLSAAEDVVQEVFLIVHRRLDQFETGTSMRAWLSAIVVRVARANWRRFQRGNPALASGAPHVEPDELADSRGRDPEQRAQQDQAVRELYAILDLMDRDRREIFVLADLEQLTAPEIAGALEMNLNTVYWKLRMARSDFEGHLFRRRALEKRHQR